MNTLRSDLEPLPVRMRSLPIDERGFVVPWFVDWIETPEGKKPEFRAMNPKKWILAIRLKLCWVCGERMGKHLVFVAGPMCGINRTSGEPPNHLECARWSVRNCPFLNNPEMVRREDADINAGSACVGGIAIRRNPGVSMLWTTNSFSVYLDERGGRLIHMGEPSAVEWYRCGRPATREEVLESVDSGFPVLAEMALKEEGAMAYLNQQRERFTRYLPAA